MAKAHAESSIAIYRLDSAGPIRFAAKELGRCLRLMTGTAPKITAASGYDPEKPGIWLGLAPSFGKAVPPKFRNAKDLFDDAMAVCDRAKREVLKRGLAIHSVGHGWTTHPFGIDAYGWSAEKKLPRGASKYFAMLDGKRGLVSRPANPQVEPLISNLCYSNPQARAKMVKGVVEYASAHPKEEVIHVWLADGSNNSCECPECQKARPSDFYVLLLNELDGALSKKGLPTRIVFLAYVDLLWGPQKNRIVNPDRFILMFAPITRSYTAAFLDKSGDRPEKVGPFRRNKLTFPRSPRANLKLLDGWRKKFKGECVDFDYHLWFNCHEDPTQMRVGRVLHQDLRDLPKLGMDGFISCQYQRVAFPTGLPMHIMGMTLWDRNVSYNRMVETYFTDLFGPQGKAVGKYLESLSHLFDPPYVPWKKLSGDEDLEAAKRKWAKAVALINGFLPKIRQGKRVSDDFRKLAWTILEDHALYAVAFAEFMPAIADRNVEKAKIVYDRIEKELNRRRSRLNPSMDIFSVLRYWRRHMDTVSSQGS